MIEKHITINEIVENKDKYYIRGHNIYSGFIEALLYDVNFVFYGYLDQQEKKYKITKNGEIIKTILDFIDNKFSISYLGFKDLYFKDLPFTLQYKIKNKKYIYYIVSTKEEYDKIFFIIERCI